MRQKISPGLIATSGDGKPSIPPPIPVNWSGQQSASTGHEKSEVKPKPQSSVPGRPSSSTPTRMEESARAPAELSGDTTAGVPSDPPTPSCSNQRFSPDNNISNGEPLSTQENASESSEPLPTSNLSSEPISANLGLEKEVLDVVGSNSAEPIHESFVTDGTVTDNSGPNTNTSTEIPSTHFSDNVECVNASTYQPVTIVEGGNEERENVNVIDDDSLMADASSHNRELEYQLACETAVSEMNKYNEQVKEKNEEIDLVSLTIASVAAGAGDPPRCSLMSELSYRDQGNHQHFLHSGSSKHKKNKGDTNSMSASARLPVISSLLAPAGANAQQMTLPGFQHMVGRANMNSSPTYSLPSMTHFLGPAKSPQNTYKPVSSGMDVYSAAMAQATEASMDHGTTPQQTPKSKTSRKPVTPAGLRLSLAASEELPDPLPIPQYSEKVQRAKQLGTVAFDRPTVLRETVQFFLQYKHYWSSHDYDRISNLVVQLFPEFKDNNEVPGVPANKRIRTDLSMYARNFRRREVSQRKKEGLTPSPSGDYTKEQKPEFNNLNSTPLKLPSPYAQPTSPSPNGTSAAVNTNNPSDFCNELLTAASIIESQNCSTGVRNDISEGGQSKSRADKHIPVPPEALRQPEPTPLESETRTLSNGESHRRPGEPPDDETDDTPIHFPYDREQMTSVSRDASTAWQLYSDQVAQMANNTALEYGMTPDQAIKKDLGTCARNMRRRLPAAKYKPSPQTNKTWPSNQGTLEQSVSEASGVNHVHQTEYMKALMAAQNMNLTELGMTQRNLGELAVLAGIKQRIEQHPQDVTDLERQYLAQCTSEEQRQALMASGAFGNDAAAMAALSAFYGQLGVDISATNNIVSGKRTEYNSSHLNIGQEEGLGQIDGNVTSPSGSKRQRRISQAEVEKRLREAELSQHHGANLSVTDSSKLHSQLTVGISDNNRTLVKREPMSPTGSAESASSKSTKHGHPHLTIPNPMSVFPVSAAHEHAAYWDAQAAALMGVTSSAAPVVTLAHSQAHIQHLPGHEITPSDLASTEAPMNLAYHDTSKHHSTENTPPLPTDTMPDTASLAAQVEVTTSAMKSTTPRRRASSSPRSTHPSDPGINARDECFRPLGTEDEMKRVSHNNIQDETQWRVAANVGHWQNLNAEPLECEQVWFPHGSGFKKENQEIVCLPDPLPIPVYSQKMQAARTDGSALRHRSEIIRETARFFLGLKYWWSSADYTRISELVVQQFPDLKDDNNVADGLNNYVSADGMTNYRRIQRDLSMCARNLRRSKKPRKMVRDFTGDSPNSSSDQSSIKRDHSQKTPKASKLSSEKRKKQPIAMLKYKKNKQEEDSAVVTDPEISGVTEDMTAAAALLQQQFMQSNGTAVSSFHPSSHLLPQAHLLPALHTHPALHEQQMQQQAQLLQQQQAEEQQHIVTVQEPHQAKALVKEEPPSSAMDTDNHYHSSVKSASAVTPISKSITPTSMDTGQIEAGELPSQAARAAHSREMEEVVALAKADQEKLSLYQAQQNHRKTYVDPEHGSDLQTKFANLWQRGKFFDASLGVANKKLHVHKLILLAMSPYLQETFKNADPRSQLEVNLPSDTTYETAKAFLRYIYEGILEVDTNSVRSLYKIATMLQMTKLAQYCQNFAHLLQGEADEAGIGESEIPRISVNLGEFAEVQAQRQRILEAQALQRLGETTTISSAEHQRNMSRYQNGEDQVEVNATDHTVGSTHYITNEMLAHHRALAAVTSTVQSSSASTLLLSSSQDSAAQQLLQAALVRNQTSPSPSTSSPSSVSYYSHHQPTLAQTDSNTVLLHRFTSPDSALPPTSSALSSSSIEQQRLALAAYWQAQAQTLGEIMSRSQASGLTSEPSSFTTASELAAIAAAAAATNEDSTRHLLSSLGCHEAKVKVPTVHPVSSRVHHHQSRDSPSWNTHMEAEGGTHQPTMLPETCIPVDMARSHHVTNSEGPT